MGYIIPKEEIVALYNDGKIGLEEHNELLAERERCSQDNKKRAASENRGFKHKVGRIGCVIMVLGIIVPLVCYGVQEKIARDRDAEVTSMLPPGQCQYHCISYYDVGPWFLVCIITEMVALLVGIVALRHAAGKTAMISSLLILVVVCTSAAIVVKKKILPYAIFPEGFEHLVSSVVLPPDAR